MGETVMIELEIINQATQEELVFCSQQCCQLQSQFQWTNEEFYTLIPLMSNLSDKDKKVWLKFFLLIRSEFHCFPFEMSNRKNKHKLINTYSTVALFS